MSLTFSVRKNLTMTFLRAIGIEPRRWLLRVDFKMSKLTQVYNMAGNWTQKPTLPLDHASVKRLIVRVEFNISNSHGTWLSQEHQEQSGQKNMTWLDQDLNLGPHQKRKVNWILSPDWDLNPSYWPRLRAFNHSVKLILQDMLNL